MSHHFVPIIFFSMFPIAICQGPEYNIAVLKEKRICPDVIPIKDCPGERAEVLWSTANLTTGCNMVANDVVEFPRFVRHAHETDAIYVVIMTDPDVPTRENPTKREYLHWLVGNIYEDNWHTGEIIVDYVGPIPEHMNGVHRMVFLVYKQPSTDFIRFEEDRLPPVHDDKKRSNFSSTNFAKRYNLTGPVAANFFMAHWTQNMVQNLSKPITSTTEDLFYDYVDEEFKKLINHTTKVKLIQIKPQNTMKTVPDCTLRFSKYITTIFVVLISIVLKRSLILADIEKCSFLKSQLTIHGVVPEVIKEAPPHEIQVTFHHGFSLKPAEKLTPSQVMLPPIQVSYPAHEKGYYFLALIDPDSPNRTKPVDREFLHYLVGNIPGVAVSRGAEIIPYYAPLPEKDTGVHRYVFTVFQQPKGVINFESELSHSKKPNNEGRKKFNISNFAQKYDLGAPLAVTFFQMKWDEHYATSTMSSG
ncbi:uncharacterized protein [Bemisia tabaci]|uniref:uncharacterized protein isoform X1 n=1 Tax=Bemisia tabaci TaxID=7038 RepID=UPI003B28A117